MSKGTPGPWDRDGIYYLLRFGRKNDGPWDDEIEEGNWMPDEVDADLIAAAPRLWSALEALFDEYDDRRAQFGSDPLWKKWEDVDAVEEARRLLDELKGETE